MSETVSIPSVLSYQRREGNRAVNSDPSLHNVGEMGMHASFISHEIQGVAAFGTALSLYSAHAKGHGFDVPLREITDYDFSVEDGVRFSTGIDYYMSIFGDVASFSGTDHKYGIGFSGPFYRFPSVQIAGLHPPIEVEVMTDETKFFNGQDVLYLPFHKLQISELNFGCYVVPVWSLGELKQAKQFLGREKDIRDLELIERLQQLGYV